METGVWFTEEPPTELIPLRGSEVVLNCSVSTSAEFPDANVTWQKNGQALPLGADRRRARIRIVNGSLIIRRVQARSDNGFYQCAASVHGLGTVLSRLTSLHVAGTFIITIIIFSPGSDYYISDGKLLKKTKQVRLHRFDLWLGWQP